MTQHSKGDWKVIHGTSVVTVEDNRLIASTGGYQTNFSDELSINKSNANIIVKTPEMFALIERMANAFSWNEERVNSWVREAQRIVQGIEDG